MADLESPDPRWRRRVAKRWIALGTIFLVLPAVHAAFPHMTWDVPAMTLGPLSLPASRVDLHLGVYTLALLYVAIAMGLSLAIGLIGLLDLGYAAFIGIGAYTLAILTQVAPEVPWWCWLPLCGVTAGVARAALGATCLRLRGDYLAVVTLGFGEIFITIVKNDPVRMLEQIIFTLSLGMVRVSGSMDMLSTGGPDGINLAMTKLEMTDLTRYAIAYAAAFLAVYSVYRIKFSRVGRAFEAIREDEIAAEAMGIPVFRVKLLAYTLGGVIAGVVGGILAIEVGSAHPSSYDFYESARVVAMVVLGGVGSLFGAAGGAIAFVVILEVFRPLMEYRLLLFGLAMVLVMVLAPQGLLSSERRRARARTVLRDEGEASL